MLELDPILSLAHSISSGRGIYAVFLGSGVSRSAGIPTGWDVTIGLIRELAKLQGKDAGVQPDAWFRQEHGLEPDYSAVLGALAKTPAERRNLLQQFFEPTAEEREQGIKTPTPAHRAIARLVATGHIRIIVTTNFDRLMEIALAEVGITPVVIANGDQAQGAAPFVHQSCVVLKLHGDYLDDRIMNTEAELAVYDGRMLAKLDQVLDEFGLVISGWSADWDPALRSAFERCSSRRYTTYWSIVGNPSPKVTDLIARRQAQVIHTAGADTLFTAIEEKVQSLDELRTTNPLTTAVAVATLKRYIVEDRFRVRLDDLVREEALRVAKTTDQLITPSEVPTDPTMISTVRALDAETETLRELMFHGCRLALADQESLFVRAITVMLPKRKKIARTTYNIWSEMRYYPASSALYAAAFGALSSRRWTLLHKLLTFDVPKINEEKSRLSSLSAFTALPNAAAKLVRPNLKTPASVHYFNNLSHLADGYTPDPDALFDEMEIWFGLAAAESYVPPSDMLSWQSCPVPPGRFMWKGSLTGHAGAQPSQTFTEAEAAGVSWPPIVGGWFGGDLKRFSNAKAAFEKRVQEVAHHFN